MLRYFESRRRDEISAFVRPRRPYPLQLLRPWDCAGTSRVLGDLQDRGDSVSDLEIDAKGIPILVRHYLELGGTLLAFNVDPNSSNVLDGLVLMDLRRTDATSLERYRGRNGFEHFRRHHSSSSMRQVSTASSQDEQSVVHI
jgi:hypothetical protein